MQNYISQLLEIMREAQNNRPTPSNLELPEELECLRDVIEFEKSLEEDEYTMESVLGVPQIYFPPETRLTDEQVRQLINGILELWSAFHYEADFRRGEFNERQQYTKLVEKWKEHVPIFRGTNGTWHFEMYDYEQYWDEDEMRYLSENEYFNKYPIPKMEDFSFDEEENPF